MLFKLLAALYLLGTAILFGTVSTPQEANYTTNTQLIIENNEN